MNFKSLTIVTIVAASFYGFSSLAATNFPDSGERTLLRVIESPSEDIRLLKCLAPKCLTHAEPNEKIYSVVNEENEIVFQVLWNTGDENPFDFFDFTPVEFKFKYSPFMFVYEKDGRLTAIGPNGVSFFESTDWLNYKIEGRFLFVRSETGVRAIASTGTELSGMDYEEYLTCGKFLFLKQGRNYLLQNVLGQVVYSGRLNRWSIGPNLFLRSSGYRDQFVTAIGSTGSVLGEYSFDHFKVGEHMFYVKKENYLNVFDSRGKNILGESKVSNEFFLRPSAFESKELLYFERSGVPFTLDNVGVVRRKHSAEGPTSRAGICPGVFLQL